MKYAQTGLIAVVGVVGFMAGTFTASPVLAQTPEKLPSTDDPATSVEELLTTDDSQSLFEVTDSAVSGLLAPLDIATETERALQGAGRADPFKPVARTGSSPSPSPIDSLPALPESDGAIFARSVRVTGIIRLGNETFAFVESPNSLSEVIAEGAMYESAKVASISMSTGEVVLQEGGETVIARVD